MDDFNAHSTIECTGLNVENVQNTVNFILAGHLCSVEVFGNSPLFRNRVLDAVVGSPHINKFRMSNFGAMSGEEAATVERIVMRVSGFGMHECALAPENVRIIADAVRSSATLKTLDLWIDHDDQLLVLPFTDAIGESETCDALSLSCATFGAETAQRFASCFWRLKSLKLHAIKGLEHLVTHMANATGLRSLSLSYGELSVQNPFIICESLEHLTLNRFRLDTDVLRTALSQTALKSLKLRFCGEVYYPRELAAVMLCVGGLVELEFDSMRLDGEIGENLVLAVSESTTLRALRISSCFLDEDARVAIAEAVGANGRIKEFEVDGNGIGDRTIYAVASAVLKSPHLERLIVRGVVMYSIPAFAALAKAIATRWRLIEVRMGYMHIRVIDNAVERSKANGALLAFCGGLAGPRTAVRDLLRKTGDHAVEHRVLGFLAPTT
jgi:hypothetical protein